MHVCVHLRHAAKHSRPPTHAPAPAHSLTRVHARTQPAALTDAEFDAAVASGQLLEHHRDLFVHSMVARRTGYTKEAIKEVGQARCPHPSC